MNNFWQGFFNGLSNSMFNSMFGGFMPCCSNFGVGMSVSIFSGTPIVNFSGFYSQSSIFNPMVGMPSMAMPMQTFAPITTNIQMQTYAPVTQNWNSNYNMSFNAPIAFNSGWNCFNITASNTPKATNKPSGKKSSGPAPTTLEEYRTRYGVTEKTLPNGLTVLACRWSRFNKCQTEWLELQKIMLKAAEELGLTLVYSDVERTNAESEAAYQEKGDMVVRRGGSHNHGVAADIVLFDKDGKVLSATSAKQREFAQRVKELSGGRITWGGDFSGYATVNGRRVTRASVESHHFEITNWRSKYGGDEYSIG